MSTHAGEFAVVTGASSGIGFELARLCAKDGFELIVAADLPEIHEAAGSFQSLGVKVTPIQVDLATPDGVDALASFIGDRPVDVLIANAGHGPGVVSANITGTMDAIRRIVKTMRQNGHGRVLVAGSVAGVSPEANEAADSDTAAAIESFCDALRAELKDTGITVTCLIPSATETDFFAQTDMLDAKVSAGSKQKAAEMAQVGYDAMMNGEADVMSGWQNKLRAVVSPTT